jgi:hypothetical protein
VSPRSRPITLLLAWSGLLLATLAGCADNPAPTNPPGPTAPPVALGPVEVQGVGEIAQGGESGSELVLSFTELSMGSIGGGSGSFRVSLTDQAGVADTLAFTGTPSVAGPGSLGATAELAGPNVLTVRIVDSDPANVEPFVVTGLGIRATAAAAPGPIKAFIGDCEGSLAGCTAANELPSPGRVAASP